MRIDPYQRPPAPPATLALLTADGTIIDEHGDKRTAGEPGVLCYVGYDTVRQLLVDGDGEALCWNGEEIRWRRTERAGWDACVLKLPLPESAEQTLAALSRWRGWLASYGAGMGGGSTGSCAWSLLRATLEEPLWTNVGSRPRLMQTMGGRQELGPSGQGSFKGELTHLDMPAAYASELGWLPYGGRWIRDNGSPEFWALGNRPVFVRAKLTVPRGLPYGPLIRRPRRPVYGLRSLLLGACYPVGGRIQGVWTWQEIVEAVRHGCRLNRILDLWVHVAGGRQPFLPWWLAVQEGRRQAGLAGLLAKMTGNSLWGQFCMDARAHGDRVVRRYDRRGRALEVPVGFKGGRIPDHCLAETVSGRIRARLYGAMMDAGDGLLAAHTDGIWCRGGVESEGWRLKERASRLDLLDPQVLRYWPVPAHLSAPWHVFAGVPYGLQAEAFDAQWEIYQEGAAA